MCSSDLQRHMADGDVGADVGRDTATIRVDHRAVLNICPRADEHRVVVGPDGAIEPNIGLGAHLNAADHHCGRRDIGGIRGFGPLAPNGQD